MKSKSHYTAANLLLVSLRPHRTESQAQDRRRGNDRDNWLTTRENYMNVDRELVMGRKMQIPQGLVFGPVL